MGESISTDSYCISCSQLGLVSLAVCSLAWMCLSASCTHSDCIGWNFRANSTSLTQVLSLLPTASGRWSSRAMHEGFHAWAEPVPRTTSLEYWWSCDRPVCVD